jgi:type I restriction enzyme M protein
MLIHEAPSRASYDLREGYLITAIAGNSIGGIGHASAYVTKEFDGCVCTNGFRVLIPKKVNPFYLLFYLRSDYFLNQIFQKRSGAAIPAVSDEDFRNILIPMPSIKEQETIAEKMKESLELRAKSRLLFEELNKSYSEEKYWFKVAR